MFLLCCMGLSDVPFRVLRISETVSSTPQQENLVPGLKDSLFPIVFQFSESSMLPVDAA